MATRALVTGGSGFLGGYLVSALRQRGVAVRVLDLHAAADHPTDVELVRADIRDAQAVRSASEGVDLIVHAVAMVPLAKDRAAFDSVNRQGTAHMLEAARAAGVRKVVHVSSSAVFGVPGSNPVTESTAPRPAEAYGRAKLAAEDLCRERAAVGLDVSIVRPRTILGPGRLGIMQILFEWVREGSAVPVLGGGANVYQFVHAADVADACVRAGERAGPAVYNVGAAEFGTMRETLQGLIDHARTRARVRSVPMALAVPLMNLTSALGLSPLGPYHSLMYGRSMYFDISKARAELGWEPGSSNVAMFCETYDWYVANRDRVLASGEGSLHRSPVKQGILGLARWIP